MTETTTTKEYLNISDSPNGKLVNRAHKKKKTRFLLRTLSWNLSTGNREYTLYSAITVNQLSNLK